MAYSDLGIVNLALGRIGEPKIDTLSITDDSPVAAVQADMCLEYVRNEVLEASDWIFAKTRVALSQNATSPVDGYDFAYTLPADFLKLCVNTKKDPSVYPMLTQVDYLSTSFPASSYVIETLPDGTLCLMTDYNNEHGDLIIRYIRRETNPARYTAHFCSTMAFRIAAELALPLTESAKKYETMMALYDQALPRAKGLNRSGDHLPDETGNEDWTRAGR